LAILGLGIPFLYLSSHIIRSDGTQCVPDFLFYFVRTYTLSQAPARVFFYFPLYKSEFLCYNEKNASRRIKNMRKYLQMLLLIMLVGAMILGAVACTTGTPSDTKQSTAVTTNSKTPNTIGTNNTTAPNLPDTPIEGGKAKREQLTFDAAVTITEENGVANVTHADGLVYRASGYTSLEGSKLHFTKGLVLQFDSALTASEFNRFTLGYVSTQPLYGKVTYTLGDNKITDDFYLEAGTDTFSCVISQYLDKKMGKEITEMSFESCNDQPAEFALCVLRVQEYPVYSGTATTYYIENERFKLGIRLAWGGGINYLLDKDYLNVFHILLRWHGNALR
jgi:hypothetical protein